MPGAVAKAQIVSSLLPMFIKQRYDLGELASWQVGKLVNWHCEASPRRLSEGLYFWGELVIGKLIRHEVYTKFGTSWVSQGFVMAVGFLTVIGRYSKRFDCFLEAN